MKIAQWLAFAWASAAVAVVLYFAVLWAASEGNPLRHELSIGTGIGVMMGSPAFLALPILVYLGRANTTARQRWVLMSPLLGLIGIAAVRAVVYS